MEMTVMTKGGGVDMLLMTKKEMMELRPGEELDELVAVRVMGFMAMMESQKMVVDGEEKEVFWMDAEGNPSLIPPYSTDMGEAWKVVERLTVRRVGKSSCGKSGTDFWFSFSAGRSSERNRSRSTASSREFSPPPRRLSNAPCWPNQRLSRAFFMRPKDDYPLLLI